MTRISDCYDPVHQAEEREKKWDGYVEKFPVCTICRNRIFPGSKIHTACFMVVCSSCVEMLNDDYEILEDPE